MSQKDSFIQEIQSRYSYKNDKIIPQERISEDKISFYKIGNESVIDLECYTVCLKIVKI